MFVLNFRYRFWNENEDAAIEDAALYLTTLTVEVSMSNKRKGVLVCIKVFQTDSSCLSYRRNVCMLPYYNTKV